MECARGGKLLVDFSGRGRLGVGMYQDDIDLLVALYARISSIMEDASAVALTIGGMEAVDHNRAVIQIQEAIERLHSLANAALATTY